MVHDECPSTSTGGSEAEIDCSEGFLLRGGDRRTLSIGDAHALLSNDRRRSLLLLLRDSRPAKVAMDSVIQQLSASESGTRSGGVDQADRESIQLSLIHHHIPKLEEADAIEWDADINTLRYRGDPVLNAFLDVTEELE